MRKPNVHKSWHEMKAAIDAMPASTASQFIEQLNARRDMEYLMSGANLTLSVQENYDKTSDAAANFCQQHHISEDEEDEDGEGY